MTDQPALTFAQFFVAVEPGKGYTHRFARTRWLDASTGR